MDKSLKDLLQAEQQAEAIVERGETKSREITRQAMADAQAIEQQFVNRIPEMHRSFLDKAEERAEQTIAEIRLRYDERNKQMREHAGEHADEAVKLAIDMILAPAHADRQRRHE